MNVAARIGQVVWPALRASRAATAMDALETMAERFPPGGVIVFGEGVDDVARLIATVRERLGNALVVSSDLERGCGQQVKEFSSLPPAMALAAGADPDSAHQAGLLTGIEARRAGIDVVFAPVADVNTSSTNPIIATRSFGDDPHRVAALASAFAAGLDEGGVLAVAKHFPGHGSTVQDSHEVLARVTRDEQQLIDVDLVPFRTLVAENIGGIMVGHLEVPAIDGVPGRPATASPNIVLDLLRRRLGFDGLVVTDALDMGGFRGQPVDGLSVLQSGLDVLLMPADPIETATELERHHESGALPDEVLDAAIGRIAVARDRARRPRNAVPPPPDLADRLLDASLTRRGPALPTLVPGALVDVDVFGEDPSGIVVPAFREALEARGFPLAPGGRRLGLVLTSVRASLGTARISPLDRERLKWNAGHGRLDAVVILGSPYELLELPDDVPGLLAYEATPAAAQRTVAVLVGEADAPGRLPVGAGS